MPTTQELIKTREPLGKEVLRLRDLIHKEGRDFTAEERETWTRVNKDYDQVTAQLQVSQRADQIEKDRQDPADADLRNAIRSENYNGKKEGQKRTKEEKRAAKDEKRDLKRRGWMAPHVKEEDRCLALQGWFLRGSQNPKARRAFRSEHEKAAEKCGLDLKNTRYIDLNIIPTQEYRQMQRASYGMVPEGRAQSLNINTGMGYFVPEGFVQNLEVALLAYANVRQWADVMRTMSGQDLPWPTVNDVTTKGSILSENQNLPSTSTKGDVVAGQVVLHAYKYTSTPSGGGPVLIPVELMEDSAFDLSSTVGELLGIRIGRIQADHFTFGTGASQPLGYVTAAQQLAAASSTAIAADDLYKLKHKVDPAYRSQAGVGWTVHDQIYLQIKLLKDGLGRYLWQASLAGGAPDRIDNDPLYINQSMDATMASGKNTVAYGALKKYKIRDVSQIRLRRLVERYADSDQEAFVMFTRADGTLLDAGTHPIYVLHHT